MKRGFFVAILAAASLALGGCAGMLPAVAGAMLSGGAPAPAAVQTASAPLAKTTFDESAYRTALAGANTLRLSVNVIIARGGLVRNSPEALKVRGGLVALKSSLSAGRSLLDLLNDPVQSLSAGELAAKAAEFRKAMKDAEQAAEDIGEALTGIRGAALERQSIDAAIADIQTASAVNGNPASPAGN